jgi:hypothetical protein
MTGKLPYYGKSDVFVILLVVQKRAPPERPEGIPDGCETTDKLWELLLRCWSFNPIERPYATEVAETVCANCANSTSSSLTCAFVRLAGEETSGCFGPNQKDGGCSKNSY